MINDLKDFSNPKKYNSLPSIKYQDIDVLKKMYPQKLSEAEPSKTKS